MSDRPNVSLELCDVRGLRQAQELVTEGHYLHRPVDARCSPLAYNIWSPGADIGFAGVLIFGRPEATRCGSFYGSVADYEACRCECTRWQVLNLARVFIRPSFQRDGIMFAPEVQPGFVDRKGVWRSTLISTAINIALDRVVVDYLLARPPCFLEEPYELTWCLSYCDTSLHRGVVYHASGFELYRTNGYGLLTLRKPLRALSVTENAAVREASEQSERSRRYRAARDVVQESFA